MQKVYSMNFPLWYSSQAKVDCITVNLMPVKAVIDDHIQRLFDALVNSLRKAINNEVNEIDTFVTSAMDTLSQRPQTVEEIGDANAKHTEFAKKKQEVGEIPSHLPPSCTPPPPPALHPQLPIQSAPSWVPCQCIQHSPPHMPQDHVICFIACGV